ncbi:hypothetical protein JET14_13160 [Martelella lutilitoris]|uniref:DUF2746 domain-containing protein n=1 Tax=Martelella lutilitoris TaxID=2583532 RepID=A0A7T7HHH4_9HYPH|nr:hypothetical protein [Martelella lutilitoris]QQM29276.1 hypothetical protein JET14_13160 [Martelella lutilitoris]
METDTLIAIASLAVVVVGMGITGVVFIVRAADKSAENRADIEDIRIKKAEIRATIKELAAKDETERAKIREEMSDFREHVARNYASTEVMNRMESRIVDALNRLGDRLDTFAHRGEDKRP